MTRINHFKIYFQLTYVIVKFLRISFERSDIWFSRVNQYIPGNKLVIIG
jgi:hypothetical protein